MFGWKSKRVRQLEEELRQANLAIVDLEERLGDALSRPYYLEVAKEFQSESLDKLMRKIKDKVVEELKPLFKRDIIKVLHDIPWPTPENAEPWERGPSILVAYDLTSKVFEYEINMPRLGYHGKLLRTNLDD